MVHQLVNHSGIEKVDFSSVQTIGSAGAYLPTELATKLAVVVPKDAEYIEGNFLTADTEINNNLIMCSSIK
jgi:hypothetical protein